MQMLDLEIALARTVGQQALDFTQCGRVDLAPLGRGRPLAPPGAGMQAPISGSGLTHGTDHSWDGSNRAWGRVILHCASSISISTSGIAAPLINCFPAFSKLTVIRSPTADWTWPIPHSGS